jgi:hypothetical protein
VQPVGAGSAGPHGGTADGAIAWRRESEAAKPRQGRCPRKEPPAKDCKAVLRASADKQLVRVSDPESDYYVGEMTESFQKLATWAIWVASAFCFIGASRCEQ